MRATETYTTELEPLSPHTNGNGHTPSTEAQSMASVLLSQGPQKLLNVQAELLFLEGQYLLHYTADHGREHYKLLTGAALRAAFSGQPVDSGWLPEGIVRWGEGTHGAYVIKWIPPAVHTLSIETMVKDGGARRGTKYKIEQLAVPLPAIVFAGVGTTYYVWATLGKEFIPEREAMVAPLPNLYPDGGVCWGENIALPVTSDNMEEAWRLFISSPFNDHLAGGKSKAFPNDIRGQLEKLAAKRKKGYPQSDLVSASFRTHGHGSLTISHAVDSVLAHKEVR